MSASNRELGAANQRSRANAANARHGRCRALGSVIGKMFGVNVGCLTDVTDDELSRLPITYVDGLHDRWGDQPAFFAHL